MEVPGFVGQRFEHVLYRPDGGKHSLNETVKTRAAQEGKTKLSTICDRSQSAGAGCVSSEPF